MTQRKIRGSSAQNPVIIPHTVKQLSRASAPSLTQGGQGVKFSITVHAHSGQRAELGLHPGTACSCDAEYTLLPVPYREDSNFQVWTGIQGSDVLTILRRAGTSQGRGRCLRDVEHRAQPKHPKMENTGARAQGTVGTGHPTPFWPCGHGGGQHGQRRNLGLPLVLEMNVNFLLCRVCQLWKMLVEHSWRCVPDTLQGMSGSHLGKS